jgi:hypothetical protein
MNRRVLGVVLAAAILIVVAIAVLVQYKAPAAPQGGSTGPEPVGLRTNMTNDGNWTLDVFGGRAPIKSLRMEIQNASSGELIFTLKLSDITPAKNNPNGILNDSNADGYLDAGDSIILRSIPNIEGCRLQFIIKDSVVGSFILSK